MGPFFTGFKSRHVKHFVFLLIFIVGLRLSLQRSCKLVKTFYKKASK